MGLSTRLNYFGLPITGEGAFLAQTDSDNKKDYVVKASSKDRFGNILVRDFAVEEGAPTSSFKIEKAGTLTFKLGEVKTLETKKYASTNFKISTSSATPPTIDVSGEQLGDSATDSSTYTLPEITLSPRHKAVILAGAFTLTGTGCELTECSLEGKCTITRARNRGVYLSHDVSDGELTVSATIEQTGSTPPTVTPATGWKVSVPLSDTNPEEGYTTWTVELVKDELKASDPEAEA